MRAKCGWVLVFGLAVVGGVVLWRQHEGTVRVREAFRQAQDQNREFGRLQAENRRLRASRISDEELDALRAGAAAGPQLQVEIDALRKQETARAEAGKSQPAPERFSAGSTVPVGEWKNVGTKNLQAALETVLWAAAGGDVKTFADMLFLDSRTRRAAKALLESLPEATRAQYATPEQLIALMSIKDVPLGAVQIREWTQKDDKETPSWRSGTVQMLLSGLDGKTKAVQLFFFDQGQGWKLFVTEGVVANYAAALKGQTSAANAGK